CNTAHAYVKRIQAHLRVPIANMLTETIEAIVHKNGTGKTVGLLATSGTIKSQLYHDAASRRAEQNNIPGTDNQTRVMPTIYAE
ncbi:aspartate/glutamate racemase family protein, partial [Pseudomonas syringae group genomosp. 7]|uniref:aspartate/glutamate racemase family protein n=1 Tax=Pseudomonas syringae group genomosp. 7 TaxID=251699 RepID=UPI00376F7D69